jgi:formylglycine-generating enzyme required for sulfatase activity
MFSTAPPPAGGEAETQLASGTRARVDTRAERSAATKAWIVVAVLAAIAIGVVGAKIGRSRPRATPESPRASAAAAEAPPVSTSAAPAPVEETAVRVQPFLTDMVRVPAGSFTMGSDKYDKNERPAHTVTLTYAFYIDRNEVTAEAYAKCVEEKECTPNRVHSGDVVETAYGCNTAQSNPRHPVNCVDRVQAEKYCAWVAKRLPTEAEWEYAARGSDGRDYPWGNDPPQSCDKAVIVGMAGPCQENRKGTWEVGSTVAGKSPFGALDMAGNVWEWVADGYAEYAAGDATDPKTPPPAAGARGVLRGGSYDYSVQAARTSFRFAFSATSAHVGIGFRCARDAP